MSIITQALKKAQWEQSLHQTPPATHRPSAPLLAAPRLRRPWLLMALGGILLLGTGAYIYIWLMPRPSISRAMLTSTTPQLPFFLSPPVNELQQPRPRRQKSVGDSSSASPIPSVESTDEPVTVHRTSLTDLAPQPAFISDLATPTPVADKQPLEAVITPLPSPSAVAASAAQVPAVATPPARFETLPQAPPPAVDRPPSQDHITAQRRFNEALEAHAARDLPQAEQLLLQAITLNPNLKAAYNSLGNLYYERQDYHRAVTMYQQALSVDPQDVKARNNLGNTYMQLAMHDEAIAELRTAIDLDDTSGLGYYNLACAYARTGAKIQAVNYLQQAIERVPQARDWARTDTDFNSVRSTPAFQKLLGASP